jgi:hypothetical protein
MKNYIKFLIKKTKDHLSVAKANKWEDKVRFYEGELQGLKLALTYIEVNESKESKQ